jgi:lysozyme
VPQINAAGLDLVKSFEGCRLEAYDDGTGTWTIGWGHTPAQPGESITQQQADNLLLSDLSMAERCVNNAVSHNITPNQFAALVSFTFNLGCGALEGSTLLACVNNGNYEAAAAEFGRWVYAGGVPLPGLVRRRAAEAALFMEAS